MRRIVLAVLLASACDRSTHAPSTTASAAAPVAQEATAVAAVVSQPPVSQPPARQPESAPSARRPPAPEELQSEEREANPTSENVTLILNITPPVKAVVMWGAKPMAKVSPDKSSIELQRPRGSGPLDLEIRADGFLPHHTRLYSDRNDKVNVRLVREADAPGLFGYRSPAAASTAKAKK